MTRHAHRRLQALLPAWLAGELPPRQAQRFAAHVRACLACRQEADLIAQLGGLLHAQDPAAPLDPARTEALLPVLHAALDAMPRAVPTLRWQPAAAVAAVALFFAAGLLTGARVFPRTVVRQVEVPIEKRVEVPVETRVEVPVEKRVEVPVVQRVEVPVERVVVPVERVVVHTVVRDRATAPAAPAPRPASTPPAPRIATAPRPSTTHVILVDTPRRAVTVAAAVAAHPSTVSF
jgi:hypothetical protein